MTISTCSLVGSCLCSYLVFQSVITTTFPHSLLIFTYHTYTVTLLQEFMAAVSRGRTSTRQGVSVKTAVVYRLTENQWKSVQCIRCVYDKSFDRWPPHLNLLVFAALFNAFNAASGCIPS